MIQPVKDPVLSLSCHCSCHCLCMLWACPPPQKKNSVDVFDHRLDKEKKTAKWEIGQKVISRLRYGGKKNPTKKQVKV